MKPVSLALAALFVAMLAAPAQGAIAPPQPCQAVHCPPTPCTLNCPMPCLLCDPPVELCNLNDRSCHPEPIDVTCGVGPGSGGGVVGDTLDYASSLFLAACVLTFGNANVALESTGDTTYYAYGQAGDALAFARTLTLRVDVSEFQAAADTAVATAGGEAMMACGFLLGPYACTGGPAPYGPCPADLPPSGGVVGSTLAYGEAACGMAVAGASQAAAHAVAGVGDVVGSVGGVGAVVGAFASQRVADFRVYMDEMGDNVEMAQLITNWAVNYAVQSTCAYAVGSCPA